MRYHEIILEGRDAPLFHGAGVGAALGILASDEIWAATNHEASVFAGLGRKHAFDTSEPIFGVSLSRSRQMAFGFGDVVFEIDQRKLAQRYKIIPIDYWTAGDPRNKPSKRAEMPNRTGDQYEFEEFCVGSIQPLSRYLLAIYVTKERREYLSRRHRDYAALNLIFDHPLFRIV